MRVSDIDTPAIIVDLDIVERNLRKWQEYCDQYGIANRPHIKTHKLVELTRRQLELGAVGITCQKIGEAEVMAEVADDILITYNSRPSQTAATGESSPKGALSVTAVRVSSEGLSRPCATRPNRFPFCGI